MKELTYNTKIAIIKVLEEILKADSIVRDSEIEYMNEVVKSFCLENDYKEDVDKLMTLQALSIIKELTIDQKGEVAKMMGKMIVID